MSEIESLQHDAARATAFALSNVISALLRPDEVIEAQREFYRVLRASLEAYEEQRKPRIGRPSRN